MILLIQIFSLVVFLTIFLWIFKAYRQILKKTGPYYLGVMKIGAWAPTFLKYSGPLLLLLIMLQISYIFLSILKSF